MERPLSYLQVEQTLARVLAIRPEHIASLRARLFHLRRLGVAPEKPGRGRAVAYSRQDVLKWMLFLELAHLGFEPSSSRELGERIWASHSEVLLGTAKELLGDWYLFLQPSLIAPPPAPGEVDRRITFVAALASDLEKFRSLYRRGAYFNLSELRRATDQALLEVVDVHPRQRAKIDQAVARSAARPAARKRRKPHKAVEEVS